MYILQPQSWPTEWAPRFTPLHMVAARALVPRDVVTAALRGQLRAWVRTVQAVGSKDRCTHVVPLAVCPVEPPRPREAQSLGDAAPDGSSASAADGGGRPRRRPSVAPTPFTSPTSAPPPAASGGSGGRKRKSPTKEVLDLRDELAEARAALKESRRTWRCEARQHAASLAAARGDLADARAEVQRAGEALDASSAAATAAVLEHASLRYFFVRLATSLRERPTCPGRFILDNYQQKNCHGASVGDARRARVVAGTNGLFLQYTNPPPLGEEVFLRPLDAQGRPVGHVFNSTVDRAAALELLEPEPLRLLR